MNIETPLISPKTGEEVLTNGGELTPIVLKEFWSWAYSDVLTNAIRGVFAEFLVLKALGIRLPYRKEWEAYDLRSRGGLRLEIKSSAYVQSWKQKTYSTIQFNIQPTQGWDSTTGEISHDKRRQADVYIFCVLHERDPGKVNPLELSQWIFYIVETQTLDKTVKTQKTITLRSLLQLHPIITDYEHLNEEISTLEKKLLTNEQASL